MQTAHVVAFLLQLISNDPYETAGKDYVAKHTKELFDQGLAFATIDTMNVLCFGRFDQATYRGYLAYSNKLKDNIGAAGLIPGYANGTYAGLIRDLDRLSDDQKDGLCMVFQDRVPVSSLKES
ncbi:hypothetical protein [Ensifer sp. LBL]|uniref:hypothetical protein n=1 Tax=Ensifer sp. LBL TaxID=2991056 RepID=UPI003D252A4E